ncbi:MAG: glycosyltransferase [Bryobacteraceae bacterium]|nr:glycosyltransferase [Bryobacteraceae bacterium]
MDAVLIIPAYDPGTELAALIERIPPEAVLRIIVVDDGSGSETQRFFAECASLPRVTVLRHAVNLGKGAALKTAFNHVLCHYPSALGVITADADGQHLAGDILRVARSLAANPDRLVLGSRDFRGQVPLRSRLGNVITRNLVRLLIGGSLGDTQTGLRGIPRKLLPHLLRIRSSGYEFELDMLIAARHQGVPVAEERIATVYEPDNPTSHFNPLLDSMRIYFVLFRFGVLSLLTAAVDNFMFFLLYGVTGSIAQSQAGGRMLAVLFNYTAARRAVFLSDQAHRALLPKYLLLVVASGVASYGLIQVLLRVFPVPVIGAKLLAETALFVLNFLVQRDYVFRRENRPAATDWDRYYTSTPFAAKLTRKYTLGVLLRAMKRHLGTGAGSIVEIGGANSCFLDGILRELKPAAYHVIDNNAYGLGLLRKRSDGAGLHLHLQDVMAVEPGLQADMVFSVGLIEHFDRAGTRRAIDAHFRLLKPGGYALISYPTPTWLYRAARYLCELAGLWKFPDERPLLAGEVRAAAEGWGRVEFEKTLWPLVFTQRLMVVRKTES